MKICTLCRREKTLSEFHVGAGKNGRASWCKLCFKEKNKQHYLKNKERINEANKQYAVSHSQERKYNARIRRLGRAGFTIPLFEEKLALQKGLCAICKKKMRLGGNLPDSVCADHDHETLKPRGLLCHNCNAGLGHFKDDHRILLAAADYDIKWGMQECLYQS